MWKINTNTICRKYINLQDVHKGKLLWMWQVALVYCVQNPVKVVVFAFTQMFLESYESVSSSPSYGLIRRTD